jgi:hypothetical protein
MVVRSVNNELEEIWKESILTYVFLWARNWIYECNKSRVDSVATGRIFASQGGNSPVEFHFLYEGVRGEFRLKYN